MGFFATRPSGRRRTRRFDLEAAAKGDGAHGLSSLLRSDRLFDVGLALAAALLELAFLTVGQRRLNPEVVLGVLIVVAAANLVLGLFLSTHHKDLLQDRRQLTLLQGSTVLVFALARLFLWLNWPLYLFPLGLFAAAVSIPFGQPLACLWTGSVAALVGLLRSLSDFSARGPVGHPVDRVGMDMSVALTLASGAVLLVLSLRKITRRGKVIEAGFLSGVVQALVILATYALVPEFELGIVDRLGKPGELSNLALICSFGLLNGLFTGYFLVEFGLRFIESTFDVVTDLRLQELNDLNQPILKKFSIDAPGSYHHSQMVGTLAEAAAAAVGANPLLCRVGATFHDIGKMNKPEYFVENVASKVSKHAGLTPTMSTLIIVSHVKDGIEMAEELGLPPRVIDFIPEHHGTIAVEYFFHEAQRLQREQGGPEPQKDDFRYPGPRPQTRETAIVMVADTVEAISRTLEEPNASRIEQLVKDVVDRRLSEGQFDECAVTLRDLREAEKAMVRVLLGIFHGRIKYPKSPVLPTNATFPPDLPAATVRPAESPPGVGADRAAPVPASIVVTIAPPAEPRRARDGETSRLRVAALLADGPGTPSAHGNP